MKKLFYLFLGALLLSCSSKPHYTITGNISGSDSIKFYLQKREAGKSVIIDSAVSKKGMFTLKAGAVEYPQMIQLVAGNTRKRTSFYIENSAISVTGTIDSLFKAKITGSKTQDEYQKFIDSNKLIDDSYSKVIMKYQAASQAGDTKTQDVLTRQRDSLETAMLNLQKDFVKSNPKSYVTPSLLNNLSYSLEAGELETMMAGLDTSIARLPLVSELKTRVAQMKTVEVGQKAPDFTLNDVNGTPVSLSSKIGPKLLLIDFWAAWCNPCRQENPNVVKVYTEFHKKGFDVLGVSLDHSKDAWIKAIADDKLAWTHISDLQYWNNAAARLYAVNSIPANFLLDETGKIVGRNLRGKDLYVKVSQVLGAAK